MLPTFLELLVCKLVYCIFYASFNKAFNISSQKKQQKYALIKYRNIKKHKIKGILKNFKAIELNYYFITLHTQWNHKIRRNIVILKKCLCIKMHEICGLESVSYEKVKQCYVFSLAKWKMRFQCNDSQRVSTIFHFASLSTNCVFYYFCCWLVCYVPCCRVLFVAIAVSLWSDCSDKKVQVIKKKNNKK